MIDSHTHIDLTPGDSGEIVAAAEEAGVSRILTVGTDPVSCQAAKSIAEKYVSVFFAVGHHPNSADTFDDVAAMALDDLANHPRCLAIGETGLDYYRERSSPEAQERAFLAQIDLALRVRKPLVIHTRAAEEDTLRLLRAAPAELEVVLHCFSLYEYLDECVERGWWFSFAGNVTYPKAQYLQEAAKRVPLERMLVETDAPYLTPQPVRKYGNQSAYVVHTARFLADLRGVSYEELDTALEANGRLVFGW